MLGVSLFDVHDTDCLDAVAYFKLTLHSSRFDNIGKEHLILAAGSAQLQPRNLSNGIYSVMAQSEQRQISKSYAQLEDCLWYLRAAGGSMRCEQSRDY